SRPWSSPCSPPSTSPPPLLTRSTRRSFPVKPTAHVLKEDSPMRRLSKLFVPVAAFTLAVLASPAVFAQGGGAETHGGGLVAIGAALAIGLAALGGGLGQ